MSEEQQEPRGPEPPGGEASWSGIELCLEKSEANPEASPGFELRSSELGPEALPPVDEVESRNREPPSDSPPEKLPRKSTRVGRSRSSLSGRGLGHMWTLKHVRFEYGVVVLYGHACVWLAPGPFGLIPELLRASWPGVGGPSSNAMALAGAQGEGQNLEDSRRFDHDQY